MMMTKLEYLKILEDGLKLRLGRAEVDEIMRDYAEYFVEGKKQGKSDFEIARNLGNPREVASQIVAESLGRQNAYQEGDCRPSIGDRVTGAARSIVKGFGKVQGLFQKSTLVLLVIVLLPFLLLMATGTFTMIIGVFSGLIGMILACIIMIIVAIGFVIGICLLIGVLPMTAIVTLLLIAVGAVAGGVLGITLFAMIIYGLWRGFLLIAKWSGRQLSIYRGHKPMAECWGEPPLNTTTQESNAQETTQSTGDGSHEMTQPVQEEVERNENA